jgi:acetate CoA/acetoacetate CoA-transferase alpha subunit
MVMVMNAAEAAQKIKNGDTIMFGGFRWLGTPEAVIEEIIKQKWHDLTVIHNDGNKAENGVGRLIANGLVKKFICTWCGDIPLAGELAAAGKMELEICPQGTFAERIRAGGFGLGGVLTPTGLGTLIEEKWAQRISLNGRDWLYHTPLTADVAIVEAAQADMAGNLVFHLTQRAFAQVICFAAKTLIVEVQNPIKPIGAIPPDSVHVPGFLVDALIPGSS